MKCMQKFLFCHSNFCLAATFSYAVQCWLRKEEEEETWELSNWKFFVLVSMYASWIATNWISKSNEKFPNCVWFCYRAYQHSLLSHRHGWQSTQSYSQEVIHSFRNISEMTMCVHLRKFSRNWILNGWKGTKAYTVVVMEENEEQQKKIMLYALEIPRQVFGLVINL